MILSKFQYSRGDESLECDNWWLMELNPKPIVSEKKKVMKAISSHIPDGREGELQFAMVAFFDEDLSGQLNLDGEYQ